MTDDTITLLASLQDARQYLCSAFDCRFCQWIRDQSFDIARKHDALSALRHSGVWLILSWIVLDALLHVYSDLFLNMANLAPPCDDERHQFVTRLLLQQQNSALGTNRRFWQRNLLLFLQNAALFEQLTRLMITCTCSDKSLLRFCAQLAAHVDDDCCQFSDTSIAVSASLFGQRCAAVPAAAANLFESATSSPERLKKNWLEQLDALMFQLRQRSFLQPLRHAYLFGNVVLPSR